MLVQGKEESLSLLYPPGPFVNWEEAVFSDLWKGTSGEVVKNTLKTIVNC